MDKKGFIVMDEDELKHYIKKYKEHELNRTSTNDRNAYWSTPIKLRLLELEEKYSKEK